MKSTSSLTSSSPNNYDIEQEVLDRYQAGAKVQQPSLCCAVEYEDKYLEILPQEIIEKDYGCGDPTLYISEGETVLDLGSGTGKNCYIIAQKVGEKGKVIGVDFNDEMLKLSRKYQSEIANKLGFNNTKFVKGKIQDLALDIEQAQHWLKQNPIESIEQLSQFETECDRLRQETPLIADNTIDVVVSNCVLNLVRPQDKHQLFAELYRVLKSGGRAVISDIVCDQDPTSKILNDPELWTGCIAGAFREDNFLKMFEESGFYGIEILKREEKPWQVIDGIEFRSLTIRAYKSQKQASSDFQQAVMYKGPWKRVENEYGQSFYRGEKSMVSHETYETLTAPKSPYRESIIAVSSQKKKLEELATEPNQSNGKTSCCSS